MIPLLLLPGSLLPLPIRWGEDRPALRRLCEGGGEGALVQGLMCDVRSALLDVGCWMFPSPFLAQSPFGETRGRPLPLSASTRDLILVFGAVVLVSTLALLWAVFFRRRRRHRHHHHHSHSHPDSVPAASDPAPPAAQPQEADAAPPLHHRHKRRRRRHKERPRNPTLAETGGLPPVRSDDPPGPSA